MKFSTKLVLFCAPLVVIIATFIVWLFPSISATSVVSLVALYISIAAFAWGRLDKDRDRAAGDRQAVIAKAAVDAAQEQAQNYLKLERPYLYIFNVRGPKHITDVEDPYYTLEYSVANYGKTPARIHEVLISREFGVTPAEPQVKGWYYWESPLLLSGERREKDDISLPETIGVDFDADENGMWLAFQEPEGQHFFLRIVAKYSGPFSNDHETSACWRWNSHGFVLHGGDQFNYQR